MDVHALSEEGLQQQTPAREKPPVQLRQPATCLERLHERPVLSARDFTPRELDVLRLLCEGLPNKVISARLGISPGTVKIHISHILRKLGVTSRLQAVIASRRIGLLG